MGITLNELDKKLINRLQSGLPLVTAPYAEAARQMGTTEANVIGCVLRFKEEKLIRVIGPVFNSRALGYESTLVAMKVFETKLEKVAEAINRHPWVSHNYQRANAVNLWFTLTVPVGTDIDGEIQKLAEKTSPEAVFQLPSRRLFKIDLYFDLLARGNGHLPAPPREESAPALLTPLERRIINEVQQHLPVTTRPFDDMAQNAGTDPESFIACLRSLAARGVMRRFGATIDQRLAGYISNVMVCWAVPPAQTEKAGQKMAAFQEVTHCYEREVSPYWPYSIFTMLHSRTPAHQDETIADIAAATGVSEYAALPTVRCFKKERPKYRV